MLDCLRGTGRTVATAGSAGLYRVLSCPVAVVVGSYSPAGKRGSREHFKNLFESPAVKTGVQ